MGIGSSVVRSPFYMPQTCTWAAHS
jgi:hypothetical protein